MWCPMCGNKLQIDDSQIKYNNNRVTILIICNCGFNGTLEYTSETEEEMVRCYKCGRLYPSTQMRVVLTKYTGTNYVLCGRCSRDGD